LSPIEADDFVDAVSAQEAVVGRRHDGSVDRSNHTLNRRANG
jgi:hypothetical protein